jgi:hypothetical protein
VGNPANPTIVRTIHLLGDHHDECDGGEPQERGATIAEQQAPRRGGGSGLLGAARPG